MVLKNFAVFEGCDGAGTTTQREIMRDKLENTVLNGQKLCVFDTFEPTDSVIGKLLRSALSHSVQLTAETMAFLFAADRNEHIFGEDGIAAHCGRGEIALCDRYVLSSLAYQGLLCDENLVLSLNQNFPAPELLVFFDIESETAFKRIEGRGQKKEIYEYIDFQLKVRARYKKLLHWCRQQGSIVELIDAALPREAVSASVWAALQKMSLVAEYDFR
jgi:dTMP kinase